jgi:hypothetical protein
VLVTIEVGFSTQNWNADTDILVQLEDGSANKYTVSKALLCNASDYFSKALNGAFVEASLQSLKLPGCDTVTFESFLYWLCHRYFPVGFELAAPGHDVAHKQSRQCVLIKLWCFADEHLIPNLQDATMIALLSNFEETNTSIQAVRVVNQLSQNGQLIWEVVMRELAHDYDNIKRESNVVQELAGIPGVMEDLIERLRGAPIPKESGSLPCSRNSYAEDWMVSGE